MNMVGVGTVNRSQYTLEMTHEQGMLENMNLQDEKALLACFMLRCGYVTT